MRTSRRRFLVQSGIGLVAADWATHRAARAHVDSDQVRLALIGCGNQGGSLIKGFSTVSSARWAYVCDVDTERRERAKTESGADHAVTDLRRVLDDKSVDAVVIATPDHWVASSGSRDLNQRPYLHLGLPSLQLVDCKYTIERPNSKLDGKPFSYSDVHMTISALQCEKDC